MIVDIGGYMALSEKLLDMLVCPNCKEKLTYDQQNEKLICEHCKLTYRITNNVPVLLVDEADKID